MPAAAASSLSEDNPVAWGAFLNSLVTFVLTAAVLYFLVVLPMNKLAERRRKGIEPEPAAPAEDIKLLTEIRDALLAARVPTQTAPAQLTRAEYSSGQRTDG